MRPMNIKHWLKEEFGGDFKGHDWRAGLDMIIGERWGCGYEYKNFSYKGNCISCQMRTNTGYRWTKWEWTNFFVTQTYAEPTNGSLPYTRETARQAMREHNAL